MLYWTTYTAYLSKLLFLFVFISSFTWSPVSGGCVCHSLTCRCKNVTFIPRLDSNITSVILEDSDCYLLKKNMGNLFTLALEELHFDRIRIREAETNFFLNFPYLKKLTFQSDHTHISVLNKVLNSLHLTNVSKLEIGNLKISSQLSAFLTTLNGANITELSLVRCYLTTFNSARFFSSLRHLQYLDLTENYIEQASWSHTDHLQVLKLGHSTLKLPTFFPSNSTRLFPNLRHLEISVDEIEQINSSTFKGLDNLEYLYLGTNKATRISTSFLFTIPKLKHLHIKAYGYNRVRLAVEYGAFKSEQLQYLRLEYFRINVDYSGSLFRHIPNLLSLEMELTRIFLSEVALDEEIKPLKKLENFTMTFSSLKKVPSVLCHLSNLTRIDLGQNVITRWNSTDCPVMSRLKFLSFTKNQIHLIERDSFSAQLIANDQLVWDLSENPFLCNCRLLWFMNWCLQQQNRLRFYPRYYLCENPPEWDGKVLNSSLFSEGQCSEESSSLIIVLVPLGSLFLIAVITATVLYYKRWSIRYFFYLIQSRRKRERELEGIDNYSFDAFVSYHHSDVEWLLKELRPKLEEENTFALCIHDRDFVAGWDIVDNIVENIEKSRKVLLLLSKEFSRSHWCRFEVEMAQQRLIEREENLLVVVLLEQIDISNLSRRLALLLKQKTYLEWTENREGQALFWQRLISCLKASNLQEI